MSLTEQEISTLSKVLKEAVEDLVNRRLGDIDYRIKHIVREELQEIVTGEIRQVIRDKVASSVTVTLKVDG